MKPLAIDLFAGLGGWAEGLLAEGWRVVGFDIERHQYGEHRYPAQLVIQDVLTLHGAQFKSASLIVASPPCQKYSYMAMPWTRAKELARWYANAEHPERLVELNALFNACRRIQREACEAAGRHIPLVVENVRGAIPWVGRSRWNHGSFHLWGDVPALMPVALKADSVKGVGPPWDPWDAANGRGTHGMTGWTNPAEHKGVKQGGSGADWWDKALDERRKNPDGTKVGGGWYGVGNDRSTMRQHHSGSTKRKFASAMIAKIPLPLSQWIARTYKPAAIERSAA